MKKRIITILSVLMIAMFNVAMVSAAEVNVPTLSVSGEGVAQCQPDRAVVCIGVKTFNKDAAVAQNENAKLSNAIQSAIQGLGISAKDIQTKNYSFNPAYNYDNGKRNEISGYNVDNTVVVVVNDVNMAGKVIDTALANGANKINSLQFSVKNTEPLRKEALQNAIKDAKNKADIIASGLGMKVTGIKNVSESVGMVAPREYSNAMLLKVSDGMADTAVSAGTMELNASIHIEYILG